MQQNGTSDDDFQDTAGNLVDAFVALDELRQATDFARRLAELAEGDSTVGDDARALIAEANELSLVAAANGEHS